MSYLLVIPISNSKHSGICSAGASTSVTRSFGASSARLRRARRGWPGTVVTPCAKSGCCTRRSPISSLGRCMANTSTRFCRHLGSPWPRPPRAAHYSVTISRAQPLPTPEFIVPSLLLRCNGFGVGCPIFRLSSANSIRCEDSNRHRALQKVGRQRARHPVVHCPQALGRVKVTGAATRSFQDRTPG